MINFSNTRKLNLILIIAGIVLNACLRDFDIKVPNIENQVAVNCFFSPDTFWEAKVYFTYHIDSTGQNTGIENAKVTIQDESGNTLHLNHSKKGIYQIEETPIQGEIYKLTVNVEGYETITAKSYVPLKTEISDWVLTRNLGPVQIDNNISYTFNKINFKIFPQNANEYFACIRLKYFDPTTGYNIYCINHEVVEKIKENKFISDTTITKLKALEGQILYSYNVVEKVQELLSQEENFNYWYFVQNTLEEYAVCDQLNYKPPSLIYSGGCISEQPIFYHAPNDYSILLMNETNQQNAEIYYSSNDEYRPQLERWLEFSELSSDYYFFLKDFSLQLSNREEINAPPVIIYSNIENGVGIFAGFQTQTFCLE